MSLNTRINSYLRWVLYFIFLFFNNTCFALQYNMTPGVTPISHRIYNLHMTVFWICVAIGVGVFSVMIYTIIFHRKSVGHKAADFHEHHWLEITWSIIPLVILIIMSVPATKVLMQMDDESNAAVTIKITGYQWKWHYEYLDQGISFFSNLSTPIDQLQNQAPKDQWYLLEVDHPLVLPIHEKIRFLVTSNDVIHSWWVPALGFKKDAIPGFIREAWARIDTPGTYRGQCAALCGTNHAFMPIVIQAVTPAEFDAWVKQQQAAKVGEIGNAPVQVFTKDKLMKEGEDDYNTTCSPCHKTDGTGMPPIFPPLKGDKIVTGPLAGNINIVLNGKSNTPMAAFGQQLNDEEIAAIITYIRNSWGNNTGDVVQPKQIKEARGKP